MGVGEIGGTESGFWRDTVTGLVVLPQGRDGERIVFGSNGWDVRVWEWKDRIGRCKV